MTRPQVIRPAWTALQPIALMVFLGFIVSWTSGPCHGSPTSCGAIRLGERKGEMESHERFALRQRQVGQLWPCPDRQLAFDEWRGGGTHPQSRKSAASSYEASPRATPTCVKLRAGPKDQESSTASWLSPCDSTPARHGSPRVATA